MSSTVQSDTIAAVPVTFNKVNWIAKITLRNSQVSNCDVQKSTAWRNRWTDPSVEVNSIGKHARQCSA